MTALRRLALAVALVLVGSLFPVPTVAFQVPINPKIDHAAKTITFEGKLYLYTDVGCIYDCTITADILSAVKADIEQTWNGHKFRCYDVVIKAIVLTGPWHQIPADAVGVRVDRSTQGFRSEVSTEGGSSWNSSDPSARAVPTNQGSTWGINHLGNTLHTHTYAHEFGHVLGLDDGYYTDANDRAQDRPGAPHDVMSTGEDDDSGVSQETIDRLVHRAGIKDSDVRCDRGWEVKITWTDTYDGIPDTMTFDGVVDTVPLGDEFVGISLIGKGTVSGSRSGWRSCNPGIDVTPNGTVSATFLAILQDDLLTVSAYADIETVLAGISTAPFTVDATVDTEQTVTLDPGPVVGDLCPHNSYGTAKIKPVKSAP